MTSSARALHSILVVAKDLGIEIPPGILSEKHALSLESFDVEGRVPLQETVAALTSLVELSEDDGIGLTVGSLGAQLHPGYLNAVSRSAANLGVALESIGPMLQVMAEVGTLRVIRMNGGMRLSLDFCSPFLAKHRAVTDQIFSYTVASLKDACAESVMPSEVGVCYPRPRDSSRLVSSFGPNLVFDQPSAYLEFSADSLPLRMCNPHPGIFEVVVKRVKYVVDELEGLCDFRRAVSMHVRALLESGTPGLADVAERMHMSRRTLQRRLDAGGISFRDILRRERHALAVNMLASSSLSIGSIAYRLGFANQSAFSRAFKQVEGVSPRKFRSET